MNEQPYDPVQSGNFAQADMQSRAVAPDAADGQSPNYPQAPAVYDSYFDGGLAQLIGWRLLGSLVTVFTLGICAPWAFCMIYRWEAKHTVINGRRLTFDGTAPQLFGKWILWLLLTVFTLGIYSFWMAIKLKKWKVKHTHFAV